jgi:hypothetical protein
MPPCDVSSPFQAESIIIIIIIIIINSSVQSKILLSPNFLPCSLSGSY